MKWLISLLQRIPGISLSTLRIIKKVLNIVPVLAVLFLSAWSYYVFIITWVLYLFTNGRALNGLFYFVVYHILLTLTLWSYLACAFTKPKEIQRKLQTASEQDKIEERNYCSRCDNHKPVRTHHCSWCEKCIIKMDHHCPWVGNCIGDHNYKAFVLMLTYCVLIGIFVGSVVAMQPTQDRPKEHRASLNTLTAVAFALVIGTGFLLSFHIYLLLSNKTTIECGIGLAECKRCRMPNHVYDKGWKRNFVEVFGTDKMYWFFPMNAPSFMDVREEHRAALLTEV